MCKRGYSLWGAIVRGAPAVARCFVLCTGILLCESQVQRKLEHMANGHFFFAGILLIPASTREKHFGRAPESSWLCTRRDQIILNHASTWRKGFRV